MAQIKIYALRSTIDLHREALSQAIHQSVVDALQYPPDKKFHRFIALEPGDFVFPDDRSEHYTIIEISMFGGRTTEAKKALIRALYANLGAACGFSAQDIEITIHETPRENWGIRGLPGDELNLNYKVQV
jgi:phenylpyruvate tautomerase PptA (4-oxalocrotonate tautomerase family)